MTVDFAEVHDELRSVARDVLVETAPRADGSDSVSADWGLLAESGWLGLEVPEELDGAGATFAEVGVVLQEMGRAATPSSYLGSVVLGVGALQLVETSQERDDVLRQVASGDLRVAVALTSDADTADSEHLPFRLARVGDGLELTGEASFVPDAPDAGRLLLLARDPDGQPVIVQLEPHHPGLDVTALPLLDSTRRHGEVRAVGVRVPEGAVWRFTADPVAGAQLIFDRGAVAIACDSLGLAEAMLDATVAYAGVRHQFGRPIGSFQAVKHACADMLVQVSVCRELLADAVQHIATHHGAQPSGDWDGAAVSMAKSFVCGAAVDVVGSAMQLHGGIGYTWESGIHVYLKRAALNRSLFGSPAAHRRRLARRY